MDAHELIQSFAEFAKQKNIDRPTMIRILEDVFRNMIKKKFGSDEKFDIIVNSDKGDFEVGEEVSEQIFIDDFGRRAVTTARQTLIQKVKDLEKDILFQKYKDIVGEIIAGEVYQVLSREVLLIDAESNEISIPRSEQIQKDRYRKGENVRAIVHKVEMVNGNPKIILSRTSPVFLERLFEQEVPEVYDGLITIKKVVREPGERAKVAVESYDDRIDPVGACVGMKGSRIHGIVRELKNENIDVINYTNNTQLLIQRSLTPAKITTMELNNEDKHASVYLKPDQVSLAIGRRGVNIKLACELTGYNIDVYRDNEGEVEEFDIDLEEFSDEIESWVIDELKRVGCDTARSVLDLTADELERRTDLEKETIADVRKVLQAEFE